MVSSTGPGLAKWVSDGDRFKKTDCGGCDAADSLSSVGSVAEAMTSRRNDQVARVI